MLGFSFAGLDRGRTSATGGNGNVVDRMSSDGRHVAFLGGHTAAVNDLRPVRYTGRHRAE